MCWRPNDIDHSASSTTHARPPRPSRSGDVRSTQNWGLRPTRRSRVAEPAVLRRMGRRRTALRGVSTGPRGDRRAVGRGGRGGEPSQPRLSSPAGIRHRSTTAAVATGDAERQHDRGIQPLRAAGRLRRGRLGVQGRGHRGRLPDQRIEGLDHSRRHRRLLQSVRPYRRGLARSLVLPGPRGNRRSEFR
jgi:hypothetical protein